MRKNRFFCAEIHGQGVLDALETNHLSRVLRMKQGDCVELFDGQGTVAEATIERIEKKQTLLRVNSAEKYPSRTQGSVILAVSFAKGQRFDWLVEKCTELGADHIAATLFHRTVKLGKSSVVDRLEKIALSAVKQCERKYLPTITGPTDFHETLKTLKKRYPDSEIYYGDPAGELLGKVTLSESGRDSIVFIGPEGGMTEEETAILQDVGAKPVSVNANILRIETAAVAFCSILAASRLKK